MTTAKPSSVIADAVTSAVATITKESAQKLATAALVAAETAAARQQLKAAIDKRVAEAEAGQVSDEAKDDAWLLMAHQFGWVR